MQAFQIVGRISSVIFEEGLLIVRGENGLLYRFEVRQ